MSFGTIVTTTKTFNQRSEGIYADSTVSFGSPANELRIRPNTSKKAPSVSVTRYKQVDYVASATSTLRIAGSVSLQIQVPEAGFTLADIDVMVAEISEFVSAASVSRMLQGEA